MKRVINKKQHGFTLVEMLLVLVIISVIVVLGIGYLQQRTDQLRIDRASSQMQQILNAGLSYYISNSSWPPDLACLQGQGGQLCQVVYLPTRMTNPWGGRFEVASSPGSPSPLFYVSTEITSTQSYAIGTVLAGRLPLSYTSEAAAGGIPPADRPCRPGTKLCTVVASVNIPGQNLNSARAFSFSGLYHNGACVPKPTCPVDANGTTMQPSIIVVPVAVSGMFTGPTNEGDAGCTSTDITKCQTQVVPISSFSAYATPLGSPPVSCAASGDTPQNEQCTADVNDTTPLTGEFWRVCLSTVSERGTVNPRTNVWGQLQGTIMAITRCIPNNESPGSGFTVWSNQ